MRLERIPAPARRFVAFTAVGVVVYGLLLGAGALLVPAAAAASRYEFWATVAAVAAALYVVYLGGAGTLRERLG